MKRVSVRFELLLNQIFNVNSESTKSFINNKADSIFNLKISATHSYLYISKFRFFPNDIKEWQLYSKRNHFYR